MLPVWANLMIGGVVMPPSGPTSAPFLRWTVWHHCGQTSQFGRVQTVMDSSRTVFVNTPSLPTQLCTSINTTPGSLNDVQCIMGSQAIPCQTGCRGGCGALSLPGDWSPCPDNSWVCYTMRGGAPSARCWTLHTGHGTKLAWEHWAASLAAHCHHPVWSTQQHHVIICFLNPGI